MSNSLGKNVMIYAYREDLEYAAEKCQEWGISRSELLRTALGFFRQGVAMMERGGDATAFMRIRREVMDMRQNAEAAQA